MVIILSVPYLMSSQVTGIEFTPPSSASLMKVADFPAGSNNGVPEIVLPLYTLVSGSLALNLGLEFSIDSYLQPNQLPDSPGAGWSLGSDLQVSRQIRGGDDFGLWGYLSNSHIPSGYDGVSVVSADQEYKSGFYVRGYDEEPDKFYYRLLDKVGVFYFRKESDGEAVPVPVPHNGIRIEYSKTGNRQSFRITDTDGTVYEYSSDNSDYEHVSGDGPTPILSWKCDRVVNAAGTDTLSFSYKNIDPYVVYGYVPTGIDVYDQYTDGLELLVPSSSNAGTLNGYRPVFVECPYDPYYRPDDGGPAPPAEGSVAAPSPYITGNPKYIYNEVEPLLMSGTSRMYIYDGKDYLQAFSYIHPEPVNTSRSHEYHYSYPSGISCRGGSVSFFYDSENYSLLDSIAVVNSSGCRVCAVEFRHGPAAALDSLIVNGEVYSFSYSRTHDNGVIADFWGYGDVPQHFSGACPVLQHDVTLDFGSASSFAGRTSASISIGSLMQEAGAASLEALLSVTYPTGGTVHFFTERHRYMDGLGHVYHAGGQRIARIDFHDDLSSAPVRQKFYRYGPDENGCGHLKETLDFNHLTGNCMTAQRLDYYCVPNIAQPDSYSRFGSERKRSYLPYPTFTPDCGTGSWVCYSEITEYDTEDGSLTGRKTSYFDVSSLSGKIHRPVQTVAYPLEEHMWDVGMLDSVVFYRKTGAGFVPSRSIAYTYNEYHEAERIFQGRIWPSVLAVPVGFGGEGDLSFDEYLFHKDRSEFIYNHNSLAVGCMQLTSETETVFEPDGSTRSSVTEYEYSNPKTYFRPTSVSVREWNGMMTDVHRLYASDYAVQVSDTVGILQSRNIIGKPIEEVVVRDGKVVSASLNIYDIDGDIVKSYSLSDPFLSADDFRFSNRTSSGTVSSSFSPDYSSYRLDGVASYGDMKRLREVRLAGKPPVCYLWGYDNLYPIASVVNSDWNQVLGVVSSNGYDSLPELFALLREHLPGSLVTGYTYMVQVGILSMTDPSGRTLYYEYDSNGRLKSVKDDSGCLIESYEYTLKNVLP